MDKYNELADENTEKRAKVTDWKTHTNGILAEGLGFKNAPKPESNYHICMIIGYNEATQEIAVSDSWGREFEIRWVSVAVANWVNMGGIFMILP